ncbi:Response regulator receiver domain-containing protein [Mucilaginibacter lappiensis]|uniref:DNA-binding response OmpR family regulator n=1 Tax=Mucilaginibacter lappiensis TaxID=354630 RepID=A0ABR6PFU3_9SPHI|nr:response regulator [Mucilaginibacter lappiensis]MBB6108624.1 DNA-binding response OmpR family regulator [Mucilaginibacter lappiensis]SIQ30395.1 Response regulator receiver domain-containing protein [Mucilaginibacter lappiensis]
METVIIQDTDQSILDILTIALQMENYQVYSVQDCDSNFMDMIEELKPHVIMLDYRLDGKICIQICHQVKAVYPHLPVIAMSCNSNINDEYDRHGFDDYIPKPFDLDNLYAVLRKHIPKQEAKAITEKVSDKL